MCHVQQSACSVSLHAHVSRLGQSRQWAQGPGPGNLRFVLFMRCKIRDTADSIALNFHVRRHHLSNEGSQATEVDYGHFVFRWYLLATAPGKRIQPNLLFTARLPSAALAAL